MQPKQIILASPRGFCAGVYRAISIVEKALDKSGSPVYVRNEIVHNKRVVNDLKQKGVVFIEKISEIPDNTVTIFSAHGVSQKVEDEAKNRQLPTIDATCPLVSKVHKKAQKYENDGYEIILIGHNGHPEVEGTKGRIKKPFVVSTVEDVKKLEPSSSKLAFTTQTTLSIDDTDEIITALKNKFPDIIGIANICYATQNRQNAVKKLAKQTDIILVVGSENSSNSNRLRDLGLKMNIPSYLIDDVSKLQSDWFDGKNKIGITAGASAPEILVDEIISHLKNIFDIESIKEIEGIKENIKFEI